MNANSPASIAYVRAGEREDEKENKNGWEQRKRTDERTAEREDERTDERTDESRIRERMMKDDCCHQHARRVGNSLCSQRKGKGELRSRKV